MKTRSLLLGCALFLGVLPGGGFFQGIACAGEARSAALVVDTSDGVTALCVELPSDSVSGMQLIQLAGQQHGLQYRIESGAVCQLSGTGPAEGDCFGDYPDFWGYWRGDGSGGWIWSSAGAASTTVEPGDVEGWSWGSGNDGSTHRRPPTTGYGSVCAEPAAEPAQPDEPKPDEGGGPADTAEGSENDPGATTEGLKENDDSSESALAEEEKKKPRKDRKPAEKDDGSSGGTGGDPVAVADEDTESLRASRLSSEDEGPPAVGLAGVGAALLLGGMGALVLRRRRLR